MAEPLMQLIDRLESGLKKPGDWHDEPTWHFERISRALRLAVDWLKNDDESAAMMHEKAWLAREAFRRAVEGGET